MVRTLQKIVPVPLRNIYWAVHWFFYWRYIQIKVYLKKRRFLRMLKYIAPLVEKNTPQYIVSLTSYGKRLKSTAPYAIISLLDQTIQPDKIILWVAYQDSPHIPPVMIKLVQKGVEIRFCEDIRSYKKFIPALRAFPNDVIITADDDLYYPKNWFAQLYLTHKQHPNKIICHRANGIKVDENHYPYHIRQWHRKDEINYYFSCSGDAPIATQSQTFQPEQIFPNSGTGQLLPPRSLHPDILRADLFTAISPFSDEIWLWAMAMINQDYFGDELPYILVKNGYFILEDVDPYIHRYGDSLFKRQTTLNNEYDKVQKILNQYPQLYDVLKRIKPAQREA